MIILDLIKEFVLTKNTYKRENFWYLLRKGLAYLSYIPLTRYYQIIRRNKRFTYQRKEYPYYYALYNATWRNDRAVEIPIIKDWITYRLASDNIGGIFSTISLVMKANVLEIGNVLSHYNIGHHDVLDKYEKGERIINEDITTFNPKDKYDIVVSISTLEHVGIDEIPSNPSKFIEALFNIKTNILKPDGTMIATVPIGQNGYFDRLLTLEPDLFGSIHCMWRRNHRSLDWIEVEWTPHLIKGARVDVKSGYGSTLFAILEMKNEE